MSHPSFLCFFGHLCTFRLGLSELLECSWKFLKALFQQRNFTPEPWTFSFTRLCFDRRSQGLNLVPGEFFTPQKVPAQEVVLSSCCTKELVECFQCWVTLPICIELTFNRLLMWWGLLFMCSSVFAGVAKRLLICDNRDLKSLRFNLLWLDVSCQQFCTCLKRWFFFSCLEFWKWKARIGAFLNSLDSSCYFPLWERMCCMSFILY